MLPQKFKEKEEAIYLDGAMNSFFATVVRVHWDDPPEPYYTIKLLQTQAEKQTTERSLSKVRLSRVGP